MTIQVLISLIQFYQAVSFAELQHRQHLQCLGDTNQFHFHRTAQPSRVEEALQLSRSMQGRWQSRGYTAQTIVQPSGSRPCPTSHLQFLMIQNMRCCPTSFLYSVCYALLSMHI